MDVARFSSEAQAVINFIESNCIVPIGNNAGAPAVLSDEQRGLVGWAYGREILIRDEVLAAYLTLAHACHGAVPYFRPNLDAGRGLAWAAAGPHLRHVHLAELRRLRRNESPVQSAGAAGESVVAVAI
jgi:hypothetical protein